MWIVVLSGWQIETIVLIGREQDILTKPRIVFMGVKINKKLKFAEHLLRVAEKTSNLVENENSAEEESP